VPEECAGKKSPLSTEHIGIALFLVRHFFPGIPVAVVGYGMVRRCLSIVAVDIFATETRPLNAVTHLIISSFANGADAAQQTQRAATTLTHFHEQHGFTEIRMLCPEIVWEMTGGHVTFNQLQCFNSELNDIGSRHELLRQVTASVEAGERSTMTGEQQERVGALARQVADTTVTHPRLMRVAHALAKHIDMPPDTRRLLLHTARPMFQGGSGVLERDLADVHANISEVKEGRAPADFRSGTTRRSRRAEPALSGITQLILQMLSDRGVRGTPEAPENATSQSSAMTERAIQIELRRLYPQFVGMPGYSALSWGCGYALKHLVDKCHVHRRSRGVGRKCFEYWLTNPHVTLRLATPGPS